MKKIPIIVVFLASFAAFGQAVDSLNRQAEPRGGMATLALVYYKIDFTREEVEYLRDNDAELIFMVSENGKAVLEKINDIGMPSIIDSMMRVNDRLPEFLPELVNGTAQNALYFMRLRWPRYQQMQPVMSYNMQPMYYYGRKLDEFEYITYRGGRFDMVIGGVANVVNGNATEYIRNGGGMKWDMMFYGDKGWGGGMVMTFHGNQSKKDYPITTPLPQNRSRITLFLGAGIGKVFEERGRGHFILQFEPCWAFQNIVTVDPQVRNKAVQTSGFSPGVVVNYSLRMGTGMLLPYYYGTSAWKNYINFHVALRPLMLNMSQASGMMYEAGISYRMAVRGVSDFKPK